MGRDAPVPGQDRSWTCLDLHARWRDEFAPRTRRPPRIDAGFDPLPGIPFPLFVNS